MNISIVNGKRSKPYPKLKGICPYCNGRTVSKCGPKMRWHWAHQRKTNCDPWWENETEWHREWKNFWPEENQEVVHFASDGEKHIADVVTDSGLVVEFQNSPMSFEELQSREQFYGNLVWIINASHFVKRMKYKARLPDPTHPLCQDIAIQGVFEKYFVFSRPSEKAPDATLVQIYDSFEHPHLLDNNFIGHFGFEWKKPRTVWYAARKPVYLDVGTDLLWQLCRYNDHNRFMCLYPQSKEMLISKFNFKK
ncbi:competence protein CoiA [Enterovibrio norvegicus]|uniref:competence protein CoiA n=1 Tax=Enterovibrio norvegicus TaxID=188144 RepID=UPI00389A79A0